MNNNDPDYREFRPSAGSKTFADRVHARIRLHFGKTGNLKISKEPKSTGSADRGRILTAGEFPNGNGEPLRIPGGDLWQTNTASNEVHEELHGFTWLDDLAALRSREAVALAGKWLFGWIERYGDGRGPGWFPTLAARRVIRCLHHAHMTLALCPDSKHEQFRQFVRFHAGFLRRRWRKAPQGVSRIESVVGMTYANLAISSDNSQIESCARMISETCDSTVDPDGTIPSRNPEELLQIATLLGWAAHELADAGCPPWSGHIGAMKRIAPVLRTLRHSDGALPRFQGGGRGQRGNLDRALTVSCEKKFASASLAMGYVRISAGSSTVVADASPPRLISNSRNFHASTLAFELSSGLCPIVVNRGPGRGFAEEIRRQARETVSHSTLVVDGISSSQGARNDRATGNGHDSQRVPLQDVRVDQVPEVGKRTLIASHGGYRKLFGITHIRRMDMALCGQRVWGEDTLWARTVAERNTLELASSSAGPDGLPFAARFHLHPEVEARLESRGVRILLRDGSCWTFEFSGPARIAVDESLYLDEVGTEARPSQQIVLDSLLPGGPAQLRWTFKRIKAPSTAPKPKNLESSGKTQQVRQKTLPE